MYQRLPVSAQTAYAQLLEACQAGDYLRGVAHLPGSFSPKVIKGIRYWYFQYREIDGKLKQVYLGPDSPTVQAIIAKKSIEAPELEAIARLAQAAIALGCAPVPFHQYRVVERLADYGFFRAGGVLVGTHAFLAYGNMLGVKWGSGDQTHDLDFAHAGKNLSVALHSDLSVDVKGAIDSLNLGFLPVSNFAGKSGATFLNPKNPEFRLDFLTTIHRGGETPYVHAQFGVPLQPLRFMEFSLENIQQAVMFFGKYAVLVNVPDPARYAVHKLIITSERAGSFAAKLDKDYKQVACLLSVLMESSPISVETAMQDAASRGPAWRKNLASGFKVFSKRYPELAEQVKEATGDQLP